MRRLLGILMMFAFASSAASAQSAASLSRLDRFVGAWDGVAGKSTFVSGAGSISTVKMAVVVTQQTRGIVELRGNILDATATLKYDAKSGKYILSYKADFLPEVTEIPVSYSDADGFAGVATFTRDAKQFDAKATIKEDKGESVWSLYVSQGKDIWGLIVRFGKKQ